MTMEQLQAFVALIEKAIDEGRGITIKADEITIKSGEITMSAPEVTIEA